MMAVERMPHTSQAQVTFFSALALILLCALAPSPLKAELPPHAENHPRLIFDGDGALDLRDDILADPDRLPVWLATLAEVDSLSELPSDQMQDDYFAYKPFQKLCLVARVEGSSLGRKAEDAVERFLDYQIELYDAELDPGLGPMAPALRLLNLVWGYDHAYTSASEVERQRVVDEILLYLDTMIASDEFTRFLLNPFVSNKGAVIGSSLILAVLAIEADLQGEPLLAQAESVGQALVDKALGDLLGADGTYKEGLGYEAWALRHMVPTWHAMKRIRNVQAWDDAQVDAIIECVAYQMLPEGEGKLLNRNNHNTSDFLFSRHHTFLEWGTAVAPHPEFARWVLRRISGDLGHSLGELSDPVATLIWHRYGVETGPEGLEDSRFFPDGGLFVHRRGWPGDDLASTFLLSIQAYKYMGGHSQEDVGQFTLHAMGSGFALDNGAGPVAKETKAHNLVLVDGRGQHNAGNSIGTDGELRLLYGGGMGTILTADLTEAYTTHSEFNNPDWPWDGMDWSWGYDGGNPMQLAQRDLLLINDLSVDPGLPGVMLNDLLIKEDEGLHEGQWRMHIAPDVEVLEVATGIWRLQGAEGILNLLLQAPNPMEVSSSLSYFNNDNDEPDTQVLSVRHTAEIQEFCMLMLPEPTGAAMPVVETERHETGFVTHIDSDGRSLAIMKSSARGGVLYNDTDYMAGDWGMIERSAAGTRCLLAQGTRLVDDDQVLISLDAPASASCMGETVEISDPGIGFWVYAPDAQQVMADGRAVPFLRMGDYVVSNDYEAPGDATLEPAGLAGGPHLVVLAAGGGSSSLRFRVATASPGEARLEIFDIQGRRVRKLFAGRIDGAREFAWDGQNENGRTASNGLYLARLSHEDGAQSRKFLLLRH